MANPTAEKLFLQPTLDALADPIVVLNASGTIVMVNRAWRRFADANKLNQEAYGIGKSYLDVCQTTSSTNLESAKTAIRDVIAGRRERFNMEYACHGPETPNWFSMCITRFESGGAVWAVVTHQNTLEHKETEAQLHQSEERWRSLVENAPDTILTVNRAGIILSINTPPSGSILPEEAIGTSAYDYVAQEHHQTVHRAIQHVFETGESTHYQIQAHGPDGKMAWYSTRIGPIWQEDKIDSAILITRDVTEQKHMEEALRAGEVLFRAFLDQSNDGIVLTNEDGDIVEWNPAYSRMTGIRREQALNQPLWTVQSWISKIDDPETLEQRIQALEAMIRRALAGEAEPWLDKIIETTFQHRDNTQHVIQANIFPIDTEWGRMLGSIMRDITEKKQAEVALRESEQRYQTIVERFPNGAIFLIDSDLKYLFVGGKGLAEVGLSKEMLVGKTPREVFPPSVYEIVEPATSQLFENPEANIYYQVTYQGRIYGNYGAPVVEPGNSIKEALVITIDITEQQQAQAALRAALQAAEKRRQETQALLAGARAVLEHRQFDSAARTIFDSAKQLVGAMSGYVALLSDTGEENEVLFLDAGGLPCTVDPELPMPIRGLRSQAYHTGQAVYENNFVDSEWTRFLPEGHVTLKNVLFAPLTIESKVVGLMGLANKEGDFTDEDKLLATAFGELAAVALQNSRTLEALHESEERLKLALRGADLGTWDWNIQTGEVIFNHRWAEILGYTLDELEPHVSVWEQLTHPDDKPMINKVLNAHLAGQTPFYETEHRLRTKSGEWRWVLDRGQVFARDLDGSPLRAVGTHLDITARKQAEEVLQKAKTMLEEEVARQTAEIRRQQSQLEAILDHIDDAIILTDAQGNILYVNPALSTLIGQRPEQILGKHISYPTKELISPTNELLSAMQTGQAWQGEVVMRRQDEQPRELDMVLVPVVSPDGEVERFVSSIRDIGHIKQLDRMKTQFMRNISHELKTPLSNLRLYTSLLRSIKAPEKQVHYLETLDAQTDKLVHLTEKVIDVVHFAGAVEAWASVSIPMIIRDTVKCFQTAANRAEVTLTVDALPESLPPVQGNALWIARALNELVENAIKFTGPGGTVWLTAQSIEEGKERQIAIEVHDNGIGLSSDDQTQISDAFIRGAKVSEAGNIPGIGLGLTIVRLILERHNGGLFVNSTGEPNQGSVFTMLLPSSSK